MDAFITRKKRARSPLEEAEPGVTRETDIADDEPTEVKLAILSSLHPDVPQDALLDILLAHDGSVADTSTSLSAPRNTTSRVSSKKPISNVGPQTSLRNFATPSGTYRNGGPSPKKAKLLSRKGTTLHLFDPADIAEHTPCSIIHSFLPPDLANELLREMLNESRSYEKITFKLFDNVVSSPHTSSFYVDSFDEMQRQKFEVGTGIPRLVSQLR